MRLLFVVQRYGEGIAGGSETYCRLLATRLAARGHEVSVVTSCATSYITWDNVLPAGREVDAGVVVHRLPVSERRDVKRFGPLSQRVLFSGSLPPWPLQREWMRRQGPCVEGLADSLREHVHDGVELVHVITYLYATTAAALPALAGRVPVVLHPTAHDEPPLRLPLFDSLMRLPDGFAFLTEEEEELVRGRFGVCQPGAVVGIGVDLDVRHDGGAAFRDAFRGQLGDDPYLLCLGRLDASKGVPELVEWYGMYALRRRGPTPRLVLAGDPAQSPTLPPGTIMTGILSEELKQSALAGALVLVQPSYFESFSMVLTEAWAHRTPALVQGRSPVLVGHARRSGGALAYRGFAEFEAAVDVLIDDPVIRHRLGERGRAYCETSGTWDAVLDRYDGLVERVVGDRAALRS